MFGQKNIPVGLQENKESFSNKAISYASLFASDGIMIAALISFIGYCYIEWHFYESVAIGLKLGHAAIFGFAISAMIEIARFSFLLSTFTNAKKVNIWFSKEAIPTVLGLVVTILLLIYQLYEIGNIIYSLNSTMTVEYKAITVGILVFLNLFGVFMEIRLITNTMDFRAKP